MTVEIDKKFAVEITYNGVDKKFEVEAEELVGTLLRKAVTAFGIVQNAHLLALFRDGVELPDSKSLEQAGVKPHDVLLLRPSAVRGG